MKKVLEDLFFGEIQPNISNYGDNPKLKRAEQVVNENEEILLKLVRRKREKVVFRFCEC